MKAHQLVERVPATSKPSHRIVEILTRHPCGGVGDPEPLISCPAIRSCTLIAHLYRCDTKGQALRSKRTDVPM